MFTYFTFYVTYFTLRLLCLHNKTKYVSTTRAVDDVNSVFFPELPCQIQRHKWLIQINQKLAARKEDKTSPGLCKWAAKKKKKFSANTYGRRRFDVHTVEISLTKRVQQCLLSKVRNYRVYINEYLYLDRFILSIHYVFLTTSLCLPYISYDSWVIVLHKNAEYICVTVDGFISALEY